MNADGTPSELYMYTGTLAKDGDQFWGTAIVKRGTEEVVQVIDRDNCLKDKSMFGLF